MLTLSTTLKSSIQTTFSRRRIIQSSKQISKMITSTIKKRRYLRAKNILKSISNLTTLARKIALLKLGLIFRKQKRRTNAKFKRLLSRLRSMMHKISFL